MKSKNVGIVIKSKLIRSAGIYTITSVVNSAIPFFLLPILTRYLSPADYGIVSMFSVLLSLVTPFIGVNVNGAIARIYYEKDTVDIKEYITNCGYILLISSSLVAIFFYIFAEVIAKFSSVPIQLLGAIIVVSFAQFIIKVVLTLWQVQVKPVQYGIFQITQTGLNMILSIVFVVLVGLTWQGRIYAQIISGVLFSLVGLAILIKNKWLKFNFNSAYIKHALNYGIPLIPHALGGVIITMTDRVFITKMVGIETTGVYTVGYQIGMIINLLATSFNQAYVPWLFTKLKENILKSKIKIVRFTYVYFVTIIVLAMTLSLIASPLLNVFIGREFAESNIYVTWIALGYAFNGMYLMVVNYIFYVEKNHILAKITILTGVLNVILNYFFIKTFGAIGAAQATTIIFLIKFILVWILSAKVHDMPWKEALINKE